MKKTIFLFLIALLYTSSAWSQAFEQEEISYDRIEKTFICYEADNFVMRQHQPDEVIGRNYRHIPLPSDRFFVTLSNDPNREPIKFTYPAEARRPYYTYNFSGETRGRLYVAIQLKNQLTPACTGRDEKINTVITIKDIPENNTLFITYKQIQAIEVPGFAPSDAARVSPGDLPTIGGERVIEEAPNGGVRIPNVPVGIINIPRPAPVEEQPSSNGVMEEAPIVAVEQPSLNSPKPTSIDFKPNPTLGANLDVSETEEISALKDNSSGCSLQKTASPHSASYLFLCLLAPFFIRLKLRKI